eukprot:m.109137 g.109137  ORF g.109137 m.109137 type:complete len:739 (+) comp12727_c0_seq2:123-2339(+)
MSFIPPTGHDVVLLFGSETGTADDICRQLTRTLQENGVNCECYEMTKAEKSIDLRKEPVIIIVSSTTGEGEPPENAVAFWKLLKTRTKESLNLSKQRYTVLGLGSTDYDNFCAMGKNFFKRIGELGASCFFDPGWADDATGLEAVVDSWCENVVDAVKEIIPAVHKEWHIKDEEDENEEAMIAPNMNINENTMKKRIDEERDTLITTTKDTSQRDLLISLPADLNVEKLRLPRPALVPFAVNFCEELEDRGVVEDTHTWIAAQLVAYRCLTATNAVKRTLEARFKLPPNTTFRPGDSFAVSCPNLDTEVAHLLKALNMEVVADKPISFVLQPTKKNKTPTVPQHLMGLLTLREVLTVGVDIRAIPKKKLLRVLGDTATDVEERNTLHYLASSKGSREYGRVVRDVKMNIADLLEKFPSTSLPLNVLFDLLPVITPRSYSACSPNEDDTVSFVFNITGSDSPDDHKSTGVCTTMFERLCMDVYNIATDSLLSSVHRLRQLEERNKWYTLIKDSEKGVVDHGDSGAALSKLILAPNLQRHIHCKLRQSVRTPFNRLVVPMYLRGTTTFRAPEDPTVPLILIGPGTGIAPFYAFAKERLRIQEAVNAGEYTLPDHAIGNRVGPIFVFFGCRHKDRDFLFKEEWKKMEEKKVLSWMFVAYSRDEEANHKYVQSHIAVQAAVIHNLMAKQNGMLYLCGGVHILQPINSILDTSIAKAVGISTEEAKALREQWKKDGRIKAELW